MFKKITLTCAVSSILLSSAAFARPMVVGLGVGITDPAYKGYSATYYPIPQFSFDNGVFFIEGLRAGLYAYNQNNQTLSFGVNYLPLSFKPSKTDDHQLKMLDKRKSTLLGEARYSIFGSWGIFSASAGYDILNESKSLVLNANYAYYYRVTDAFSLTPSVGVSWFNNKHNNYYYGVSRAESLKSGLAYHDATSSFMPFGSLTASLAVNPNIQLYAGVRFDLLTGDAKDSPMVGHDVISSFYTGLSYRF